MGLFGDWQRLNRANKEYLRSQGRPTSYLGQVADIPNQMRQAADVSGLGLRMARHLELTNGIGLPARAIVLSVQQVGTYAGSTPVLRVRARIEPDDGTEPYVTVSDQVVAGLHLARLRPEAELAVMLDPANPADFAVDWIRTGRLGPPPPGSVPGPGAPGARRTTEG
ncbi:hypothetical protein [Nocardioides humi]|uniref:Uncharacterized protein n=1 Tax=Nocardioides humi TaxID=449461 RepID=A0ABN2AEJ9_9ACTN|nr:hypothetical protein [Nocardioides humi]